VDYIQFVAFNQPGAFTTGHKIPNSGTTGWDNQTFLFDACGSIEQRSAYCIRNCCCDTLYFCIGDTPSAERFFLLAGNGTDHVITVDTTGNEWRYHQISNTPGNTATARCLLHCTEHRGIYTITITATDDGSPAGVTSIPIVFVTLPAPTAVASNDTTICPGSSGSAYGNGGSTYSWSPRGTLSNPNIPNPVATPVATTTT